MAEGGDPASGVFPGKFSDVASRFSVSTQFVSLWQNLCATGDHLPSKKLSGNPSHLKPEDIELMEFHTIIHTISHPFWDAIKKTFSCNILGTREGRKAKRATIANNRRALECSHVSSCFWFEKQSHVT